jgi:hypothetical protein
METKNAKYTRNLLFNAIDEFLNGKMDKSTLAPLVKAVNSIHESARLELSYKTKKIQISNLEIIDFLEDAK